VPVAARYVLVAFKNSTVEYVASAGLDVGVEDPYVGSVKDIAGSTV
jgi:hypothetical protein